MQELHVGTVFFFAEAADGDELGSSGTGGQTDFVRGATRSPGGKSLIVLQSTVEKGSVLAYTGGEPVYAQIVIARIRTIH